MAENIQRSRGRPQNYKQDRGGVPSEYGPFKGVVMSNVDPTRSGRLRVYIETFGDGAQEDDTKWTTVDYLPSFFGTTPPNGTTSGVGTYPGNRNSYGMWFCPPDLGVEVLCVFANGDRDQGYYIGVVPEQGSTHMVPAIGATKNFIVANQSQAAYFAGATQLPVTEINSSDPTFINDPRYFETNKPVQSVQAAILFQQGLIGDNKRGPIASTSQRETPSQVFGISTPGRPIYAGGKTQEEIVKNTDSILPQDAKVIGRMGGHTLVMDDGAVDGSDQLVRIRTGKGHQITMSDSGEFFYITHANGQTWLEFGKEGTVDVFSTNSINLRTQGDINIHADKNINMYAGENFNVHARKNFVIEAELDGIISTGRLATLYSKQAIGIKADGQLALESKAKGSWGASQLVFKGATIDLNGPAAATVTAPTPITTTKLAETTFAANNGWKVEPGTLTSIVTRAPTHEPYPFHDLGTTATNNIGGGSSTPAAATPLPAGVKFTAAT